MLLRAAYELRESGTAIGKTVLDGFGREFRDNLDYLYKTYG